MSRRDEPPEIKIHRNIEESKAPLVAGFYLEGPTIAHVKKWNFKNDETGKIEPKRNNNLIQNYTFWKPGKYSVWVEIIGPDETVIKTSETKTFTVKKKTDLITSFNQWEGIVYGGDDVGFSISHSLHTPKITWEWGDNKKPNSETNPHHPYDHVKEPTKVKGKLSVYESEQKNESREFAVLVIPHPIKEFAGYMEVSSTEAPGRNNGFPVNTEITLQAQIKGGVRGIHTIFWQYARLDTEIINVERNEGENYLTRKKSYEKSGHYHVKCVIRYKDSRKLTLEKGLIITNEKD